MQARILEHAEENLWNEFLKTHPLATIHQTPEWGHFQQKIPQRGKYWIIILEEEGKIVGGTLLMKHQLPKGYCWLYAPRGPLLQNPEQMSQLLEAIKPIAKAEKAVFLRVDPPYADNSPYRQASSRDELAKNDKISQESTLAYENKPAKYVLLLPRGFRWVSHGFQPEHTLILDLTKSEEELLAQMKPKGRYNIRLAEKKGVIIQKSNDIGAFFTLLQQTTNRDHFSGHNLAFYQAMLDEVPSQLYLAHYKNEVLAGIIVTYFKDTATYYFGASSNQHREFMAPYLIQWQAIRDAKAGGYKKYDFFGTSPGNFAQQNFKSSSLAGHPWAGITEFKQKFGGQAISYQKAQEFAFKKALYAAYRLYKKLN